MPNQYSIHAIKPKRTCTETYRNYLSFKPYLRGDFNKRCGYCDDDDFNAGGSCERQNETVVNVAI